VGGHPAGRATRRRRADHERAFVQALATQTALTLERARLFAAERRARERSAFLTSATDLLASGLDPRHVLEHLVAVLCGFGAHGQLELAPPVMNTHPPYE
jgi:hypothetical protein